MDPSDVLARIVAVICGLVAAGYVVSVRQLRRRAAAVPHWPRAEGAIITSRVHAIRDGPMTWHQLEISYRYVAGGRSRRATCIRLGYDGRETDPARARAILERYPAGAPVTVYYDYYDPRRPSEAALEPSGRASTWACAACGPSSGPASCSSPSARGPRRSAPTSGWGGALIPRPLTLGPITGVVGVCASRGASIVWAE